MPAKTTNLFGGEGGVVNSSSFAGFIYKQQASNFLLELQNEGRLQHGSPDICKHRDKSLCRLVQEGQGKVGTK